MSIADKITRLTAAKTGIAAAITAKGGTVGAGDGLEDFAADIGTISGGGGGAYDIAATLDGNGDQLLAITDASGSGGIPPSISKIAGGSFTLAQDKDCNYVITHNLGVVPKGFRVWCDEIDPSNEVNTVLISHVCTHDEDVNGGHLQWLYMGVYVNNHASSSGYNGYNASNITDTTFKCGYTNRFYKNGKTYKWLAWA